MPETIEGWQNSNEEARANIALENLSGATCKAQDAPYADVSTYKRALMEGTEEPYAEPTPNIAAMATACAKPSAFETFLQSRGIDGVYALSLMSEDDRKAVLAEWAKVCGPPVAERTGLLTRWLRDECDMTPEEFRRMPDYFQREALRKFVAWSKVTNADSYDEGYEREKTRYWWLPGILLIVSVVIYIAAHWR
jgi:hypothetical protein